MRNIFFCLLVFFLGCKTEKGSVVINYDWLEGTWQKEGTSNYEIWSKVNSHSFQGMGLKKVNEDVQTTEYLRLYKLDGKWRYAATVPSQNNGETIEFVQTKEMDRILSFENKAHDFPQKIKYQLKDDSTIKVDLSGADRKAIEIQFVKVEDLDF